MEINIRKESEKLLQSCADYNKSRNSTTLTLNKHFKNSAAVGIQTQLNLCCRVFTMPRLD